MTFAIIVVFISAAIIALEIYLGCAIIGWTGDNMVVTRDKSPGPYWFSIAAHVLIGIVLPMIFLMARLAYLMAS